MANWAVMYRPAGSGSTTVHDGYPTEVKARGALKTQKDTFGGSNWTHDGDGYWVSSNGDWLWVEKIS